MGRTVSFAPGYALEDDQFDPRIDDFESKDRPYIHFDLPLSEAERQSLHVSEQDILKNSFWPLIGYTVEERRIRRDSNGSVSFVKKERPIKFCAHRDAAILDYYTRSLSIDYESYLIESNSSHLPLAYRSGIGNNISHSKALFDEIRSRGDCWAIALDISGFFDHIRHDEIYEALCQVRRVDRLSAADFKIYKRMTAFEWVDSDALQGRLGRKYGRNGRLCQAHEFRSLVRDSSPGLVRINEEAFGIPQGTPLSGLYANLSMMKVDLLAEASIQPFGGSYRRYSDDIAIIVDADTDPQSVLEEISKLLGNIGLEISAKKTEISRFKNCGDILGVDRPFQYLGFVFDGTRTLVRQSSLNRYYAKMHDGVRSKVWAAKKNGVPADQIFMRELFRKYTHFGKSRNFPRYVYRAADVHGAIEMRHQIRNHMTIFRKQLRDAIASIY